MSVPAHVPHPEPPPKLAASGRLGRLVTVNGKRAGIFSPLVIVFAPGTHSRDKQRAAEEFIRTVTGRHPYTWHDPSGAVVVGGSTQATTGVWDEPGRTLMTEVEARQVLDGRDVTGRKLHNNKTRAELRLLLAAERPGWNGLGPDASKGDLTGAILDGRFPPHLVEQAYHVRDHMPDRQSTACPYCEMEPAR
jgi:hypothetical protein